MKKAVLNLTLFCLIIFCCNLALAIIAADNPDILFIRDKFTIVQKEFSSYTKFNRVLDDDCNGNCQKTFTYYQKGEQTRLYVFETLGDMSGEIFEYYIWDNQLIFIYNYRWYNKKENKNFENRFYFKNGKMIRWIDTSKKEIKEHNKLKNKESELLKDFALWQQAEKY